MGGKATDNLYHWYQTWVAQTIKYPAGQKSVPQPFFFFIYLLFGSFLTSNMPTTCDICMRTLMIVIIIIASGCVCVFSAFWFCTAMCTQQVSLGLVSHPEPLEWSSLTYWHHQQWHQALLQFQRERENATKKSLVTCFGIMLYSYHK